MPTFGTVCDGIGCGHLAFNQVGFECAWSFEIEPFPSAVLAYRFPEVTNHGDMLKCAGMVKAGEIEAPDVFIGGTPCQAFSVAGKRKGLEDARGNLSLTFCGIADTIDDVRGRDGKPPCAVLWENVPGVLSDRGNAFGCFLGELAGSGCELQPAGGGWRNAGCVFGPRRTVAWRVLDSQFFGVAQRRRRVFVVASAGDGCRPEEVLFEREGVRRDSPPSREAGKVVTHDAGSGSKVGHWDGGDCHPSLCSGTRGTGGIAASNQELFSQRGSGLVPDICGCLSDGAHNGGGLNGQDAYSGRIIPVACPSEVALLSGGDGAPCVAFDTTQITSPGNYSHPKQGDPCHPLASGADPPCVVIQDVRGLDKKQNGRGYNADGTSYTVDAMATPCVATDMQVRRLTPRECERLQGLPDDWTLIPWRGKSAADCPDGPRYKGIGNGQTVNVMRWLAERIKKAIAV